MLAPGVLLADGHVVGARVELVLGHGARPELVLGAGRDVVEDEAAEHAVHVLEERVAVVVRVYQVGVDHTRVHGHRGDVWVAPRQLAREQDVRELGLAIPRPGRGRRQVVVLEVDSHVRGHLVAHRRHVDDPHVRAWLLRRLLERREEELGQEEMPDVIRAQLDLVPFLRRPDGHGHDTGVVEQKVQTVRL